MRLPRITVRERRSSLENPSLDLVTALVAETDGTTVTSLSLTPTKALRNIAVYACVRAIAEPCASLPIPVTELDDQGRGRTEVPGDDRSILLNGYPNPEQTTMELIENWVAHAMLWGTGYIHIARNGAGRPFELWPLRPDRTTARRTKKSSQLYYTTILDNGQPVDLLPEEVIPLHAILGLSPIKLARMGISAAMAAEEYGGRFWANNARPGGVIEFPDSMEDDEFEEFKNRWRAQHEGLRRGQLVGILTGGAKWNEVGIAPGLAQFIETRQFGVREIARLYRVPPHIIGDLEGTVSRASIEQQAIEYVTQAIRPWLVRMEQRIRFKMFNYSADLNAGRYAEFRMEALMRGDVKSRYDAYGVGIQWGFLNRADARMMEGLAVPAGELLDEYLVPLNMVPANMLGTVLTGAGPDNGKTPEENGIALTTLALMMRDRNPALAEAIEAQAKQLLGG